MYYVYLIQSIKDKSIYIGFSRNLRQRIKEHNSGKGKYSSIRRPYRLVYYEAFKSIKDARLRESRLKSKGGQRDFIKENLKNSLE